MQSAKTGWSHQAGPKLAVHFIVGLTFQQIAPPGVDKCTDVLERVPTCSTRMSTTLALPQFLLDRAVFGLELTRPAIGQIQ